MPKYDDRDSHLDKKRPGTGAEDQWESLQRLAESLGNISEACRRAGISRFMYYEWKKKAGRIADSITEETSKLPKRHPQTISVDLEREVIELAIENPEWGCDRISYYLKLNRKNVSSPTVQKILIRNKIGKKFQRLKSKEHPEGGLQM